MEHNDPAAAAALAREERAVSAAFLRTVVPGFLMALVLLVTAPAWLPVVALLALAGRPEPAMALLGWAEEMGQRAGDIARRADVLARAEEKRERDGDR